MVWIQRRIQQSTKVTDAPTNILYVINIDILDSYGIDRELFLYRVDDDSYVSVAVVKDLQVYPPTKEQAMAEYALFYRKSSVEISFTTQSSAVEATERFIARLDAVVRDQGTVVANAFGGTEITVYDSEDP